MDTAEALKKAMEAVKDAGIPEDLWSTALPLALADLRNCTEPTREERVGTGGAHPIAQKKTPRPARKAASSSKAANRSDSGVFKTAASEPDFLDHVAHKTETTTNDLSDVFHIENGELHLKVLPKDLGDNDKAKTMCVTALMAGAVFAGTDVPSIPFSQIHEVCKTLRCYSTKHGAEYIRETPGFGSIGTGKASALTHKNGWENEFAKAVARVLKKSDDNG